MRAHNAVFRISFLLHIYAQILIVFTVNLYMHVHINI